MSNPKTLQKIPAILFVLMVLVVIANFLTLTLSPLPWFDEVFFADMTNSLVTKNNLELTIVPTYLKGNVFVYGPVYFLLEKLILLGKSPNIFTFRALNLVSGFISVWQIMSISKTWLNKSWQYLLGLIILIDAIYITNSHSGRMDLLVMSFALFSYQFAKKAVNNNKIYHFLLTGLFAALSILTSPRGLFLLVPVFMLFLYHTIDTKGKRLLINIFWMAVAAVIPFFLYIHFIVGDLATFLAAFQDPKVTNHFSISLWRESYEMPAIILSIILCFGWILYNFKEKNGLKREITTLFITILLFLAFVKNVGPYTAMIIPLVYLSIFLCLNNFQFKSYYKFGIIGLLFAINASIFFVKFTQLYLTRQQRNLNDEHYSNIKLINNSKAKVFAPFAYYYYCIGNNLQYENNEVYLVSELQFAQHIIDASPDFIIANELVEGSGWLFKLKLDKCVELVAESNYPVTENWLSGITKKVFKQRLSSNYNFKLYKVVCKK